MWFFTGVYGPTLKSYREPFWEELGAIRGLWSNPWCIGGDFNVIRFPSERSREGRLSGTMRRFSEVLDELALRDLPLQGGPYTWSGGLNGQSRSRLDRFPISEDSENHFSGVSQCTLPRPVFNHFPILLDGGGVRRGPIPFRFENMWLKEEGFKELLKGWWQGFNYSGSYNFVLSEKLKALKVKLKNWNKEVFGKVGVNLRMALDKVSFWDDQERQRALNEQELEARKEAREEFKKWAIMEEILWRQKSRETWLKEGDKNTGFFHKMANSNSRRNCLKKIKVNVPKKGGADDLRDYRPINLVGGLYKILAKVLANRLKKVVTLIANEAISSLLKGDEAGVLCKLNLEKAYDHINWDFLMTVMQKMGFGEKWTGWIRWCISIASFSVLINGSPAGMEALSCLINRAVRGGFLTSCKLRGRGGNGIQVSHLLFTDDTLVFCEDSQDQMVVLSWLLMWFEASSGLSTNLNKSEILSVGRVENAEVLASELGCKVGSLPSTYLGLPLGAPHKSVAVWDGVEERMRKRLALWKRQFISKREKITLIRSTLASMSIYLMSLMRIPRVVRLRLEKIQRDFLWGGGALEKRSHLVKWDVVRSHKRKGDLGIINFSILNRALLCKWSWRFAAERESYWKLIISRKYGEEGGGWISREVREGYGVGLWKEIRKEGVLMFKKVSFTVGDSRRVKFWKDIWCGNIPLCEAFPSLFGFAVSQDAWVADCWDSMGDAGG
ncbi:uncharacterized protein LOC117933367 [Vitis riparia]|uniref:uncharacterized protein LOC117933367 n=1 Tax=Vitis riparia TaxID=96939 RepID=UPI00155A4DCB|nr:uncharacterized protein LOC117933367 [Vitis riparia]